MEQSWDELSKKLFGTKLVSESSDTLEAFISEIEKEKTGLASEKLIDKALWHIKKSYDGFMGTHHAESKTVQELYQVKDLLDDRVQETQKSLELMTRQKQNLQKSQQQLEEDMYGMLNQYEVHTKNKLEIEKLVGEAKSLIDAGKVPEYELRQTKHAVAMRELEIESLDLIGKKFDESIARVQAKSKRVYAEITNQEAIQSKTSIELSVLKANADVLEVYIDRFKNSDEQVYMQAFSSNMAADKTSADELKRRSGILDRFNNILKKYASPESRQDAATEYIRNLSREL